LLYSSDCYIHHLFGLWDRQLFTSSRTSIIVNLAPPCFLLSILGMIVFVDYTPIFTVYTLLVFLLYFHIFTHCTPLCFMPIPSMYFFFFLLSFFFFPFFFFFFFLPSFYFCPVYFLYMFFFSKTKNILKSKKFTKNRKITKNTNFFLFSISFNICLTAHIVWHTYFQIVQKHQKIYKVFKNIKISNISGQKVFFKNYVIFDSSLWDM